MTWFIGAAIGLLVVALVFGRRRKPKGVSLLGTGVLVAPFCAALVLWGLALNVPDPGVCQSGELSRTFAAAPTSGLLTEVLKLRDARDTHIALGNTLGRPARRSGSTQGH